MEPGDHVYIAAEDRGTYSGQTGVVNSAIVNTARHLEDRPCETDFTSMNGWSLALPSSLSLPLSWLRRRLGHTSPPEVQEGGPGTRADAVGTARLDIGFLGLWTCLSCVRPACSQLLSIRSGKTLAHMIQNTRHRGWRLVTNRCMDTLPRPLDKEAGGWFLTCTNGVAPHV